MGYLFIKILLISKYYIFLVVSTLAVSVAVLSLAVESTVVVVVAVESTLVESVVDVEELPEQAANDAATKATIANFAKFFMFVKLKVCVKLPLVNTYNCKR